MSQEIKKTPQEGGVTRGLTYGQLVVTILLVGVAAFLAIQNVQMMKRLSNLETKTLDESHILDQTSDIMVARQKRQFGSSFEFENFGTVATYWNTHSCLSDGLPQYRGYVGAVADSSAFSGGHKLECIKDPISSSNTASRATSGPVLKLGKMELRGVVPSSNSANWRRADGKRMPCTKCVVPSSDVVTGYGTTSCGNGFSKAYDGYAMTSWSASHRSLSSDMICVRQASSSVTNISNRDAEAPQLTFVQVTESTPNGRPERKIVRCVVCKKSGDKPFIMGTPGASENDRDNGAPGDGGNLDNGAPGREGVPGAEP